MLALMVVEEIGVGVGGRGGGSSDGNDSGGGDEKKISKRCLPNLEAIFFLSFRKRCQKDIIMSFVFRKIVFFSNVFPPLDIRGQKDFLAKKQTPP